jgi:hypothetical protein
LSVAVVFGNAAKNLFEVSKISALVFETVGVHELTEEKKKKTLLHYRQSMLFIFSIHPYDVGDLVAIGSSSTF